MAASVREAVAGNRLWDSPPACRMRVGQKLEIHLHEVPNT